MTALRDLVRAAEDVSRRNTATMTYGLNALRHALAALAVLDRDALVEGVSRAIAVEMAPFAVEHPEIGFRTVRVESDKYARAVLNELLGPEDGRGGD